MRRQTESVARLTSDRILSVYRSFQDIQAFEQEIKKLRTSNVLVEDEA